MKVSSLLWPVMLATSVLATPSSKQLVTVLGLMALFVCLGQLTAAVNWKYVKTKYYKNYFIHDLKILPLVAFLQLYLQKFSHFQSKWLICCYWDQTSCSISLVEGRDKGCLQITFACTIRWKILDSNLKKETQFHIFFTLFLSVGKFCL